MRSAILLLFAIGIQATAAITPNVQKTPNTCSSASNSINTLTCTFPGNVASGNLISVGMFFLSIGSTYSNTIAVTDSVGTTYQQDVCALSPGANVYNVCLFSGIAASSAADTYTITWGTAVKTPATVAVENSGTALTSWLDQIGSATMTTSANPTIATAGATAVSGELIIGLVAGQNVPTAGAGYTGLTLIGGTLLEYKAGTTPQVETASWTMTSGSHAQVVATYKPPATNSFVANQSVITVQ